MTGQDISRPTKGGAPAMIANSHFHEDLSRGRQRDMQARAERERMARQSLAQSRMAKSVERPMRRVRRVLRAAFA